MRPSVHLYLSASVYLAIYLTQRKHRQAEEEEIEYIYISISSAYLCFLCVRQIARQTLADRYRWIDGRISIYLSIYLSICACVYLHLSEIYLSICVYLSIYPPVYLYPSVYLAIYLRYKEWIGPRCLRQIDRQTNTGRYRHRQINRSQIDTNRQTCTDR